MKRTRSGGRPARRATRRPSEHGPGRRSLALRLELAREEERARVARELHDELGQVLTSLKLEFMWLVDQLRNNEPKPGLELVEQAPVVDRTDRSRHSVCSPDLERPSAGRAGSSGVERRDSMGGDEVRGTHGHSLPAGVGSENASRLIAHGNWRCSAFCRRR